MNHTQDDWITRAGQRAVSLPAFVHRADGTYLRGQVFGISHEKCKMVTKAALAVGETIMLDVPGYGQVDGQILWRAEERYGVRLLS